MPLALSLHIAFLVVWSATLLYLPQLLLREAMARDDDIRLQLFHMQRWLYSHVMTPSALLTVVFGIWLVFERDFEGGWLPVKLALVLLMGLLHVHCGTLMSELKRKQAKHRLVYYRVLAAAPALPILAVVALVTGKPF